MKLSKFSKLSKDYIAEMQTKLRRFGLDIAERINIRFNGVS